jgi:flagellar basal-body rod protein FlgC
VKIVAHGYRGADMIYPVSNALSALHAFRKQMDVTANNIANVNTDEFKKSRVNMQESPHGGVQADIQQIDSPGYPKEVIRDDEAVEVESSNVDLVEEMTDMITAKAGFNANLKTVSRANQMLGSLLDILG